MQSKMSRIVLSFSILVLGCVLRPLQAANVLWDCFELGGTAATLNSDGEYYLGWKMPGQNPYDGSVQYMDSGFLVSRSSKNTILTDYYHIVECAGMWTQVALDCIIDQTTFDNATSLFADSLPMGEPMRQTDSVVVNGGQDVYLAFVSYWARRDASTPSGYNIDKDNPYFGWVGLNVNQGEVTLLGSYVDLDHNPVIAGRYESLIPEPSSALLLLVGGALLALGRRKCYNVRRVGKQSICNG